MGRTSINFAEVEGGFEAVPEGTYDVVIEKVEVRESKSSEHDYLSWEYKIVGDDYEGQRLWDITSFSPRALFRMKDVFEALGVLEDEMTLDWDDDVEITQQSGPMLLEPDVIGMECQVVVKNEMYENKERNRIVEVRAAGGSSSNGSSKSSSARKTSSRSSGAKKSSSSSRRRALR